MSAAQRKVRYHEDDGYSSSAIKFGILKKLVANNKLIHLPTSRHHYFYSLKFFKNFDYRCYLLTVYTEHSLIKSKAFNPIWTGVGADWPLEGFC